jgi:molybdopterin-binding protein
VALARALATDPEVLLLDEPLAALDNKMRRSLRPDFKNMLAKLDVTSIYVTHDLAEACTVSDRIAVMGSGRIEQVDYRDRILEKPNSGYVAEFLGLNVYSGKVVDNPSGIPRINIDGIEISTPSAAGLREGNLLITLKPEDVVLSSEPTVTNPRWNRCTCNNLAGTIIEIIQMKSSAEVTVDVGFLIKSEMTLSPLKELGLDVGKRVFVHFKGDSLSVSQM